jgi:thiol-disulfide isomerase/thioredoxin
MFLIKRFCIFFLIAILVACSNPSDATDSQGNPIYLSDYQGKWLYINYWATWCAPCIEELPALAEFYKENAQHVAVIGVNFDHLPPQEIATFASKVTVNFPLVSQLTTDKLQLPHPKTLPTTYVIDPQGRLIETLSGPQTVMSLASSLATLQFDAVLQSRQ